MKIEYMYTITEKGRKYPTYTGYVESYSLQDAYSIVGDILAEKASDSSKWIVRLFYR